MNENPTTREILDAVLDLRDAVAAGFAQTATRAEMNERFAQVDARFAQVDARFVQVDARFDRLERRVGVLENRVDDGFTRIEAEIAKLKIRRR